MNPKRELLFVYNMVFQMCTQREFKMNADRLYNFYFKVLFKYYTKIFLPKLKKTREISTIDFLIEFTECYEQNHCIISGMQRIFSYLDRSYIHNKKKILNIKELGFILYKKIVFDYFKSEIRALLLRFIRMKRCLFLFNEELLNKVALVFIKLGKELPKVNIRIYKRHFRKQLKIETKNFFRSNTKKWLKKFTESHYLIQCEKTLQLEMNLFKNSLNF